MNAQFYGIKYPFSEESELLTFFDLDETKLDGIRSKILHIIFTPKGQRLRHPEFGTDLIKYIFEPNDSITWDAIKEEIRKQISRYLPEVIFNNISILQNPEENDHAIFVEVDYSVQDKGVTTQNKTLVRL
jgi:phage baseplate assembly protein W